METSAGNSSTVLASPDGISWYSWALVAILGLVALKVVLSSFRKKLNLPPSPGSFPVVGSFPLMGAKDGEPPHFMFTRLADKFGPLMYLQLGANPTIIISNSDMARLVLKDNDNVFASRPYLSAGKHMGMNFRSVVFAPSGPYYKRLRKIYTQELLSTKRIHAAHPTRERGVLEALGSIYQQSKEGQTTELSSLMRDLSLNNLLSMIFGRKDGKMLKNIGTVSIEDVKSVVRQTVELGGEFNFGDFITIARWLDIQGVIGRMKKLTKVMKAMSAALLEEYERSGRKSCDDPDATILDVLLSLDGEDKLTSVDMSGVMFDMIVAGSDTTSVSSDWTIAELLRQPHLLQKLQAELDEVVGDGRFVMESDVPNLPYLQAVVKESLRLHPPAPLGIPHCSTQPCKLAGYDIPAGTTTMLNIYAIQRDAKQWSDPLRFDPERFVGLDISTSGTAYNLLPFSSGRRRCSGMVMGLASVHLIVANMVHSFDFEHAGGVKNADIDVVSEMTGIVSARAKDLIVHARPRLPWQLFESLP